MANEFVQNIIETAFEDNYKPIHQQGPDYVSPTTEPRTWLRDGVVRIPESKDVMSVVTFFRQTVKNYPKIVALITKRDGINVQWTYAQYLSDVNLAAKGFIKLGLEPFNGVCMLGFNSPEWLISFLGTIFAGGLPAGIYTTNSPTACLHVLQDCDANIVVVENEMQLEKILKIRENLPKLKAIIQYIGKPTHPDVISWVELLEIGRSVPDSALDKRIKALSVNQCCCLIYTSGTTGNPKGVMISHDNVMAFNAGVNKIWDAVVKSKGDRVLSYLPLSHLAALSFDLFTAVQIAATVYFATPDALKGKMVDSLLEAQPTALLAVPRVLEKIYEKLVEAENQLKPFQKLVFKWAQTQGINYYLKKNSNNIKYNIAKKLVFQKIKKQMGLQCITDIISGGAPLDRAVKEYLVGLDLPILDAYGLSESTGLVVGNRQSDMKLDGVGDVSFYGDHYKVKISNPSEDGTGEIITHGRNVFMGYLKLEKETKETIDEDQWLYTGDLGFITENNILHISGRLKELIITAGGENIGPIPIENAIKKNLAVVSNCMLIGDMRKYLTMLITLKTEINLDTLLPTDELTSQAIEWCRSVGSQANTLSEILETKDEKVMRAIQEGFTKYNDNEAISNAQRIQKWTILSEDFSIGNGDFGPTLKLRRPIAMKKYSAIIDKMYKM